MLLAKKFNAAIKCSCRALTAVERLSNAAAHALKAQIHLCMRTNEFERWEHCGQTCFPLISRIIFAPHSVQFRPGLSERRSVLGKFYDNDCR